MEYIWKCRFLKEVESIRIEGSVSLSSVINNNNNYSVVVIKKKKLIVNKYNK